MARFTHPGLTAYRNSTDNGDWVIEGGTLQTLSQLLVETLYFLGTTQ